MRYRSRRRIRPAMQFEHECRLRMPKFRRSSLSTCSRTARAKQDVRGTSSGKEKTRRTGPLFSYNCTTSACAGATYCLVATEVSVAPDLS